MTNSQTNGDGANGPSPTVPQPQSAHAPLSGQPSPLANASSVQPHGPSPPQAQGDHGAGQDLSALDDNSDNAKRPRLRLAHACDRCRRRKIKCDTQHPCTPCQQSNNVCTFETPSRRTVKPKGTSAERVSGTGGVKRPHSPGRSFANLATGRGENQAGLEARLAALESMLRDVPPNVHNAFLSTLDARLGSGTGVGIKEGGSGGEGVGVAAEALGGTTTNLSELVGMSTGYTPALSPYDQQNKLAADWGLNSSGGPDLNGWLGAGLGKKKEEVGMDELAKKLGGMSFFYEDEIGQAKWQGATSGFPLLHLLAAHNASKEDDDEGAGEQEILTSPAAESTLSTSPNNPHLSRRVSSASTALNRTSTAQPKRSQSIGLGAIGRRASSMEGKRKERFFPDRTPRPHQTLNPEASWKVITGVIPPDLMDTLVRCYLSTSHLLWPFLHVPSFLADYANPAQWGEPGFTCFIVAVCTLSSRHVDDPRVRANPNDPSTAGKQYFELFKRLRDLPSADRPTLYSIQAAFLAAIYAFGLGNLSKAFALQAESITLCLDGGLHRSVDAYDHFDAVEKETRKRTFWSIYSWDKQSAALFGRPPIIHLRDCDVTEPIIVDDENLVPEGIKDDAINPKSRMCAFVATIRLHVILEGVIDSATSPSAFPTSPFLARAAATIARRMPQTETLRAEEELLEEWKRILPKYWNYDTDTANSRDPIRITQAERLHCLEHLVKMIIYRHRFSGFVAIPACTPEERTRHLDLCKKAMQCALTIIADHVHISQRGMMTYYGVHVIHQLAQAGRTLVAVILNCRNTDFRPIIAPSIEGLRSCVGLLRRFSGRYLCGLRSADIIDEFCRVCNIPVDSPRVPDSAGRPSPAWLRPVRKHIATTPPISDSPASSGMMNFDPNALHSTDSGRPSLGGLGGLGSSAPELEALFNTAAYFNVPGEQDVNPVASTRESGSGGFMPTLGGLGEASAPFDRFETLTPNASLGNGNAMLSGQDADSNNYTYNANASASDADQPMSEHQQQAGARAGNLSFDYGMNGQGFGGESLATAGMDNVSDGLKQGGSALSAATILSLMEEGSFDYGSVFTDQAP
ncbi:nuclear protein [Cryptococcus wingfieldii CBS 7118]|uniref:Nuclear protein n=1 Tax=Cryptococcus wingfieldii CBS 7118 TaxID=1295528 RepID=A0A1E3K1N0_9TREE|nr:nuclear protein [Cryptococcus wingfieldii CBS 7118]ODO06347.1 nuclear protein [Cryptococcus wingfieldii CBS 7118]